MKGRYGIIFAVFVFIVSFAIEARAVDWKYFFTDVDGILWLYDTQSVSRGQDTTTVLVKKILSDKEKARKIKAFPKIIGIEKISYIINKDEINCSKNMYRVKSAACYGSEGEGIVSYDADEPNPFLDVFPDTVAAGLVKALCGEKKEGGK